MTSLQIVADFSAAGLLLATFFMMSKVRLVPMLRYFAVASFFLASLGVSILLLKGEEDFYLAPLATIFFKVIFIPLIIYVTSKKIPSSNQLRMYFRSSTTLFLFALALVVSGVIVRNFPADFGVGASDIFFFKSLLFISTALVLSGILMMVVRRDLFSQALGILTVENGIAAFGLVALHAIPLFLEMGIFFVVIVSTLLLAALTENVHKTYAAGDTQNLTELIG